MTSDGEFLILMH